MHFCACGWMSLVSFLAELKKRKHPLASRLRVPDPKHLKLEYGLNASLPVKAGKHEMKIVEVERITS